MSTGKAESWRRLHETFKIADQQCPDVRLGMSVGANAHEIAALRSTLVEATGWLMGSDGWEPYTPFTSSNGHGLFLSIALAGDDGHVRRAIDLAGEAGDLLVDDVTASLRPSWASRGTCPRADIWFHAVIQTALERRPNTSLAASRTVNDVTKRFGDHCYYCLLPISPLRASMYLIDLLLVGCDKPTIEGMSWQDAKAIAEKHVKAHGGAFPSVKRLAQIVGCSRPTIDRAIRESKYLKARKAEAKKWGHEQSMTEVVADSAAQATEDDPSELAALIEEQEAEIEREERRAAARKYDR